MTVNAVELVETLKNCAVRMIVSLQPSSTTELNLTVPQGINTHILPGSAVACLDHWISAAAGIQIRTLKAKM